MPDDNFARRGGVVLDGVDQVHAPAADEDRLHQAGGKVDRDDRADKPEGEREGPRLICRQVEPARRRAGEQRDQPQADGSQDRVDHQQGGQHLVALGVVALGPQLGDILHRRGRESQVQQSEKPDDRENQGP